MNVTLTKPHTHEGVELAIGDKITVDADTAQWLAENGVIAAKVTPVSESSTTKPAKE